MERRAFLRAAAGGAVAAAGGIRLSHAQAPLPDLRRPGVKPSRIAASFSRTPLRKRFG